MMICQLANMTFGMDSPGVEIFHAEPMLKLV